MSNLSQPERKPASPKFRVLIVCDDDFVAEQLRAIFLSANIDSHRAKGVTSGSRHLELSLFQVVFTVPIMHDGSWRQLFDFAGKRSPAPSFVVMASWFDLQDWGESLEYGAFDVLNIANEISKAAEIAEEAFQACISAVPQLSLPLPNFSGGLSVSHEIEGREGQGALILARAEEKQR